MARMTRVLLLLTVVLAAAAFVNVASADGWLPTFRQKSSQDKVKEGTEQTIDGTKSWTKWAADYVPYFSGDAAKQANEKLDSSKDMAKDTVGSVAESGEKNTRTAADTAKDYASKGLERMTSTKDQLHGATMGFIQKWGSWAKDNVGKYYSYGPLAQKSTQKAGEKATEVVKDAANSIDSAADSSKEKVTSAEEEVSKKTDEKEL